MAVSIVRHRRLDFVVVVLLLFLVAFFDLLFFARRLFLAFFLPLVVSIPTSSLI
jgi:hypothetical protein